MAMKSFSVCALEPEKITKTKWRLTFGTPCTCQEYYSTKFFNFATYLQWALPARSSQNCEQDASLLSRVNSEPDTNIIRLRFEVKLTDGYANLKSILWLVILLKLLWSDLEARGLQTVELLPVEAEDGADLCVVVALRTGLPILTNWQDFSLILAYIYQHFWLPSDKHWTFWPDM